MEQKSEIVLYQPEGSVSLEVRLENEPVWLTQQQMSELFQTTKQNISLHTGNIFKNWIGIQLSRNPLQLPVMGKVTVRNIII